MNTKQLLSELKVFNFKIVNKQIVNDFIGNIYDIKGVTKYTLKSPFIGSVISIYEKGNFLISELQYRTEWIILSYDQKSIQKAKNENIEINKILKILEKYTNIPNEKNLLIKKLKEIKNRGKS